MRTSYDTYFSCIADALLQDDRRLIQAAAQDSVQASLPEIIHVRAEKHGALYHPASLELVWPDGTRAKYALLVAISGAGRDALHRESDVLERLHKSFHRPYLPRNLGQIDHGGMTFLLAPWFSGFHEFHMKADGEFSLWDHDLGLRRLSPEQADEVFFQAARILTLYVDSDSGACIHPWSHAAGDFIVRMDDHGIDVRLTTARGYGPLVLNDPLSSVFAYFLDLTLRMRLDRVNGVGEWAWLNSTVLTAAINGFFAGVAQRGEGDTSLEILSRVLSSFSEQELLEGHSVILDGFSANELALIIPRLEIHCRELFAELQRILISGQVQ